MMKSCNTIVNRGDHVQYLTVSKSYSDNCTCSLTGQNATLKNLHYGLIQLRRFIKVVSLRWIS